MGEIDIDEIQIDGELLDGVSRLAIRHYGDASDISVLRVIEAALELYLLWLDRVEKGVKEVDEPLCRLKEGEPTPLWNRFWNDT
jgi:hypothetical protein